MNCPHCKQWHPTGTKFCPETGREIPKQILKVPGCTNVKCANHGRIDVPSHYKFCPLCGSTLNPVEINVVVKPTSLKSESEDGKDPGFGTFLQVSGILLGIACVVMAFFTMGLSLHVLYGAVRMYNAGEEQGGKLFE